MYVLGDTIIQINIPNEIREAMDRIYNNSFSATLIPKPKINQLTTFINEVPHKKTKIHVHIIKNKDMAREISNKTLKHFKL